MPSMSQPIRVYGRWREQLYVHLPAHVRPVLIHVYDVPIPLSEPLAWGKRVQLTALSPAVYRSRTTLLLSRPLYDVYDPRIEGRIIGAAMEDERTLSFLVMNECWDNKVGMAILVTRLDPRVSKEPKAYDCPRAPLSKVLCMGRRAVPLRPDAVVLDHSVDKNQTSPTPGT